MVDSKVWGIMLFLAGAGIASLPLEPLLLQGFFPGIKLANSTIGGLIAVLGMFLFASKN